jgi:hypothetical protein
VSAEIEIRIRSTPTRFGGRHSIVGFIPDGEFVTKKVTLEQHEALKKNHDLYLELGAAPKNLEKTEKAIAGAVEALEAEKKAHGETRHALEKMQSEHAALAIANGRLISDLETLKKLAGG